MKIAVFRALQLGDILCAIPAIRTLKRALPGATLFYVGLPTMRPLLQRYAFIDVYIDFPGYRGLPEQPYDEAKTKAFVKHIRSMEFDLLVQMQGNGTIVNSFLAQWGSKRLVGFCPESDQVDEDWLLYPDTLHEVDRHLQLVKQLGVALTPEDRRMAYPLFPADWDNFSALKGTFRLNRYAIVHVGSRSTDRQWPLRNFAVLAEHLLRRGLQIVLTGTAGEAPLALEMQQLLPIGSVINLAGRTSLGLLGCVVQQAELLVSNCTGISHIAAALETKSLILSLDGEPERWGPQNQRIHHTFDATSPLALPDLCEDLDRLLAL